MHVHIEKSFMGIGCHTAWLKYCVINNNISSLLFYVYIQYI